MSLIAVIMASPSRDARNNAAKQLLDYGFANYEIFSPELSLPEDTRVIGGADERCTLRAEKFCCVVPRGSAKSVKAELTLEEKLKAPINCGDRIGTLKFTLDGKNIGECNILADESIPKISYFQMLDKIVAFFLLKR